MHGLQGWAGEDLEDVQHTSFVALARPRPHVVHMYVKEGAYLLAQQAGDLGEVDQGALGTCGRHGRKIVAWERLGLPIWQTCLRFQSRLLCGPVLRIAFLQLPS